MPKKVVRYIDLFCGIGGFRIAIQNLCEANDIIPRCVLSSDIDAEAQKAYSANFGETPLGDIRGIDAEAVPDHDILLAGFPCQPFSIIGNGLGFNETRGTLFFEIARIIEQKNPRAILLENVKQLRGHQGGRTLETIVSVLSKLGYQVHHKILNALDFGLPQKRERIFIVGFRGKRDFRFPEGNVPMTPLSELLEKDPPEKYMASEYIRNKRKSVHPIFKSPSIWHENKAGHLGIYPYSCALRAGASYNYLLVDGKRRLTPREMLRLQGFPDSYRIVCSESQTRKQAGNSVAAPVVQAVLSQMFQALGWTAELRDLKGKPPLGLSNVQS